MLQALGTVLDMKDAKTLTVSLEGINFILKAGQQVLDNGENPYALVCEQSGVMDKIEALQFHENQKVYEKSVSLLENFFQIEGDDDIVGMVENDNKGQDQSHN